MRYVQPLGISDVNASHIDGNPALGIEGTVVPAAAIEHPMREIVHVIREAGLEPSENDLTQLFQAIFAIVQGLVPVALPAFPIGYPGLMPWEVDELETEAPGWYPATGLRFPLDSHPGQALWGLSTKYKTNWGVNVTDVGGVLHINTPNYYHTDGRGLFMRPGTLVGSVVPDATRNFPGILTRGNTAGLIISDADLTGPFALGQVRNNNLYLQATSGSASYEIVFDPSRVVPTAGENRPLHVCLTPAVFLGV